MTNIDALAGTGTCLSCSRPTVPPSRWRTHRQLRNQWKVAGVRQGAGRSLCRPCYIREWRQGSVFVGFEPRPVMAPACSIDDCANKAHALDLCQMHYRRLRKFGALEVPTITAERRFWAQVEKGPSCWRWTGYVADNGYGKTKYCGVTMASHRAAYLIAVGPIPPGYQVDHVLARGCVRTDCVNPSHLEAVTPQENNRRSNSVSAQNARKTACLNGHPFDDLNTYWVTQGERVGRHCKACKRQREAGQ